MNNNINWKNYIIQMEYLMNLNLDESIRSELIKQMKYIEYIASPLMSFPLEDRLSIAGVYKA
ncbi:DUF4089 domain-containing protein [Candidatus Pantoea edessiphila]|uniref:DUF4089 domain-containing protein n=1 Tax=Candidatus Pantoea edessiphila TaxID=2044610 RepID=A0A2P5SZC6_9GAMM|nr:oxalurate catabolism protein HpxX [Candidatus Pantoea edessiphila]PPI87685.1 DUF4089 domain-containing protein [Candidatus Pantoea edessiphila]